MNVTIHLDRNPAKSFIEIDGQRVKNAVGVKVEQSIDAPSILTLKLLPDDISITGNVNTLTMEK